MKYPSMFRKTLVWTLVCSMFWMNLQSSVIAAVIGNDQLAVDSELQIKRDEVATFLAREDVRSALLGAGVDSKNVDARVRNLSDAQILQIHKQIKNLPAGGDGGLGIVVAILVIFILLDLAGITDVFPGINHAHR